MGDQKKTFSLSNCETTKAPRVNIVNSIYKCNQFIWWCYLHLCWCFLMYFGMDFIKMIDYFAKLAAFRSSFMQVNFWARSLTGGEGEKGQGPLRTVFLIASFPLKFPLKAWSLFVYKKRCEMRWVSHNAD